jgi:uncharacterized protein (DUF2249 family)
MLARGQEPFSSIMAIVDDLAPGEELALRSPFDPAPLHRVLAERGFTHEVREVGPDQFETVYRRAGERAEDTAAATPPGAGDAADLVVDVRGMTPPRPLDITLAALDALGDGRRLLQINDRVPVFLLPLLDERGYHYAIDEDERGTLVTIWRDEGTA